MTFSDEMIQRAKRSVPYGIPLHGVPMKLQHGVPVLQGPPMKVHAMPIPKSGVPMGAPGPRGKLHCILHRGYKKIHI